MDAFGSEPTSIFMLNEVIFAWKLAKG